MVNKNPHASSRSKNEPTKFKFKSTNYPLRKAVSSIELDKTMETKLFNCPNESETTPVGLTSTSISSSTPSGSNIVPDTPAQTENISKNLTNLSIEDSQIYSKLIQNHMVEPIPKILSKNISYQVPVSNNFEILSENGEENMEIVDEYDEEDHTKLGERSYINVERTKCPTKKVSKPPPIIIHHKMKNSKEFVNFLKTDIKKGFEIKHTRNNTNLFINDTTEYTNYLQKIKCEADDNFQFHTYTPKQEKTHGFVLRGLDNDTDMNYLKEEFNNQKKIEIINIYKMKNTNGLFLIITDNSITEKYLNRNLNVICHTRISWKRHINTNTITQCRRCQQWGHATSNCSAQTRCLKCAQNHWSRDCTLVDKEDKSTHNNIKCPNCEGPHIATSKDCPVYIRRLEIININKAKRAERSTPKLNLIPAPLPKSNPWINRNLPTQPPYLHTIPEQSHHLHNNQNDNRDNTNTLMTLMGEFQTLNTLIDLNHMLMLVRELNTKLSLYKNNPMQQFVVFSEFCKEKFNNSSST